MKSDDGQYSITVDELAAFRDSGHAHWWLNADGGTSYSDSYERVAGWPVYLGSFGPPWFDQWAGDLERACEEQLNPLLRAAQPHLPPVEGI